MNCPDCRWKRRGERIDHSQWSDDMKFGMSLYPFARYPDMQAMEVAGK